MFSLFNFSSIFSRGGSADPICPYVRTPMPGYGQVDWLDAAGVCFHQSQLDLGHESFINPVVKLWRSGCISQLPRFLAQLVKILCQISPKFWPQITKIPGLSTCLHLLFFYLCLLFSFCQVSVNRVDRIGRRRWLHTDICGGQIVWRWRPTIIQSGR